MRSKRTSWLVAIVVVSLVAIAEAAAPSKRTTTTPKREAPVDEIPRVTEQNGPWMIMAAVFSGDSEVANARAREQAAELVRELRTRHKLPAYTYEKKFDFTQGTSTNKVDRYGAPRAVHYQQGDNKVEMAVLVGDYSSVDDPTAQRVLKKLKYLEPTCLKVKDGENTNQSLAGLRSLQREIHRTVLPNSELLKKGPMGQAFIVTNPLIPPEYFAPKGLDKLVLEMNKKVTHSLLDCPKRYTVKVATFNGHAIILDEKNTKAIEAGRAPKSYLESAAANAHILTEALCQKGYEAYEFHDRGTSMVTIGSFDSVGTPRPDGKQEINPVIHKIMQTFGAPTTLTANNPAEVGKAKKLAGIPFDVQPMPVEVPRHRISVDYATSKAEDR